MSWFPPFVVGLAAAVAGEVAVGLLLYVTPGFVRALTLILAVLLGSFALGLWTAPISDDGLTERLRRRWLLVLFAFASGSVVSGIWSVRGGLAGAASTRGLGLALLAALPLYACGALLGGMSAPKLSHVRGPVGSAAAAGAAIGTVLAGYVLASLLLPVSIYAFCLVLLSGAALVHGAVIAAEGERRTLLSMPSRYGVVAVEEWSWGKSRRERVLLENGRVRGLEDGDGRPVRRWERAAVEIVSALVLGRARTRETPPPAALLAEPLHPAEMRAGEGSTATAAESEHPQPLPGVLVVGGGAFTLPRLLLDRDPGRRVAVVERNPSVLEAAQKHFPPVAGDFRLSIAHDQPTTALERHTGPYTAIIVDSMALAPHDPLPFPDARGLLALRARLVDGGVVFLGGIDRNRAMGVPLDSFLAEAERVFPSTAVLAADGSIRTPPGSKAAESELALILSTEPYAHFPSTSGGLRLETIHRAQRAQPDELGRVE